MRKLCVALMVCAWVLPAQDLSSRMDEVVKRAVDAKRFMGSVLVARDSEVLFRKSYGFANLEWDTPNTDDTKYRIGSLTKQFTAACVLLLEQRGKLKTTDLIKKYYPDAPAAWDKITIYNLLTHTTGIHNLTAYPDYPATMALAATPESLVARFRNTPLDFPTDEKFAYSNSNYTVLGYLIEKVSGQSYQAFLEENVLTPLGLKETGYDSPSKILPHRASGYMQRPAGLTNAEYVNMTVPYSAGALYSTAGDLWRWEQGLFGGKLLSADSLHKMTTPYKGNYACGLMIRTANGRQSIQHGGAIQGFTTFLAYSPEDKLTVVAMSNLGGPAPQAIAAQLEAIVHAGR